MKSEKKDSMIQWRINWTATANKRTMFIYANKLPYFKFEPDLSEKMLLFW